MWNDEMHVGCLAGWSSVHSLVSDVGSICISTRLALIKGGRRRREPVPEASTARRRPDDPGRPQLDQPGRASIWLVSLSLRSGWLATTLGKGNSRALFLEERGRAKCSRFSFAELQPNELNSLGLARTVLQLLFQFARSPALISNFLRHISKLQFKQTNERTSGRAWAGLCERATPEPPLSSCANTAKKARRLLALAR